jgi:HD superfamily phosphodiesterase
MWDKANEIMKDVYNQILLISTIAAIVTAAVALLLSLWTLPLNIFGAKRKNAPALSKREHGGAKPLFEFSLSAAGVCGILK